MRTWIVAVALWAIGTGAFAWNVREELALRRYDFFIVATARSPGTMQVFWDKGAGTSESDSKRFALHPGDSWLYSTPFLRGHYQHLRIDPIDRGASRLDIQRIGLFDRATGEIADLPLERVTVTNQIKALSNRAGELSIVTDAAATDPSVTIDTPGLALLRPTDLSVVSRRGYLFASSLALILLVVAAIRRWLRTETQVTRWVALLLVGVAISFFRNPEPILHPALFAEDGTWIGRAFNEGWRHLWVATRPDYFVWGNLGLLAPASYASFIFNGYDLDHLPEWIAFCSYVFLSAVACCAFFTLSRYLSVAGRWVVYGAVLLVPVGTTGNEIIGRALNVGYLFGFIAVLLLLSRESYVREQANNHRIWAIDLALLVCCNTNPICYPLLAGYLLYRMVGGWKGERNFRATLERDLPLALVLTIFGVWIATRLASAPPKTDVLSHSRFYAENLIEVGLARSLLFGFVFPWYRGLQTGWVVAFSMGYFALTVTGAARSERRSDFLLLAFAWMLFAVATIAMRPGLTQMLGGYGSTFPDRYFYAQNLIAVLLAVFAVERLPTPARAVGLAIIAATFLIGAPALFQYDHPLMAVWEGTSFQQDVANRFIAQKPTGVVGDQPISVPIHPAGWSIEVPERYLRATALHPTP